MSLALICAASCGGLAQAAQPARSTFAFDIPPKALGDALVDFAIQAGISISTQNIAACAPQGRRLVGRFTVEAGLRRILAGTGCSFRMVDPRAVEIVSLPPAPIPPPAPKTPPSSLDLAEVVVVATRRAAPVDRLAYAVSAVDGQTLTGQGVGDAGDLAMTTPSMVVTNLGAGRDKILLRGLSDGPLTGRTQSMVGIYLDGARITYNAPDPDLKLVDMAQVEVLRGPQGALYGAGSLGGVLSLVTARPDPSGVDGWISVGVGGAKSAGASSDLAGMANFPLFDHRGAVRLVAYREVQGGYIDDAGLDLTNVNRSIRQGWRLVGDLALGQRWTLSAGVVNQAINSDDTQYALVGKGTYRRRNALREPHDNDFTQALFSVRGDLGWSQARWSTAYIHHRLESRYDATVAPPVPVPAGPAAFDDDTDIESLVTEANLISGEGAPLQWLAGLFLAQTDQSIDLSLTGLAGSPVRAFDETRRDRLTEGALYGEAILPLNATLSLTLGGRLFFTRSSVSSLVREPLSGFDAAYAGRLSDRGFAPKVVLAYSRSPSVIYYLQAAEGYRAGGINTTTTSAQRLSETAGTEPGRFYQGDELWSFEAGGKWSLLDGRLRLRAAAFQAVWTDIQSDQLLGSGLPFTANIGNGRNLGLEVEGRYRSGPLEVRGEFLVNSPELEKANPAFPTRSDQSLAAVPEMSAGASAHYAWPLPQGRSVEVDARLAFVGRSRLVLDAGASPPMGDYVTGRLAATLASDRWRLTAALDNPGDVRGDTFAYGNPFSLRTTPQSTPLRPRTASVTLRVSY